MSHGAQMLQALAIGVAVLCSALVFSAQSTHDLGIGKLLIAKRDAPDSNSQRP